MNLKLIKQKNLLLLLTGKLISLLGSNIQQFALSLYVLALTGSATIFASILSISILPRLLLSPIAGVFGDWFNRKKVIVFLDIINSLLIGLFALIFIINGSLTIIMIYILVILLEMTEIFFQSSMSAVIPSIVKKEELLDANAFNSLVVNIGQLLAPVIGALLYGAFGLKIVLIINAVSFLISGISEMFIKVPQNNNKPERINYKSFKNDLMEGINTIKSNKAISTIIGLGTIINFCAGPLFSVGLIFIIKEVLLATDFQFGLFQMIFASSMVLAPILCSGFIKKIQIGRLCYLSFIVIALLIFTMAIIPSNIVLDIFIPNILPFILLIIITFIIGMSVTVANISVGTLFNQVVPIELMGRTSTVLNLAVTIFIPVGNMVFGFLFDTIASSYVIITSGLILLVATLIFKKPLLNIKSIEDKDIGDEMANEI